MHYSLAVQSALFAFAHATPILNTLHTRNLNSSIQWTPCEKDASGALDIDCGSLAVPLDYTDVALNATLELNLRRIPATKTPSKGSILLNYGGPGGNGTSGIFAYGALQMIVTGGYHDLITFDPRGTGNTIRFSCYGSDFEKALAQTGNPLSFSASDAAAGKVWGLAQIFADTCGVAQNKTGELVGTSFVARDMISIVDALNEDGLLRYWGISYGTILGSVVSAMFPERIDRVLIDGVVNPHEYFHGYETELFTNTDSTFEGFLEGCISNSSTCPLARNQTASQISDAVFTYLEDLKYNPLVLPSLGYLLEYATVKNLIFSTLYYPAGWPSFSIILDALMNNDIPTIEAYAMSLLNAYPAIDAESQFGIKCSDSFVRADELDDVLPASAERSRISKFGDIADSLLSTCAQWRFDAKERYEGDFHVKTRHPLLVIGNTHDPVTPLVSAQNASAGFEGSVVLQQDGYGHATIAQGSLCTAKAIAAYFTNGTLPEVGTICPVDVPLWSDSDGFAEVLEKLSAEAGVKLSGDDTEVFRRNVGGIRG